MYCSSIKQKCCCQQTPDRLFICTVEKVNNFIEEDNLLSTDTNKKTLLQHAKRK